MRHKDRSVVFSFFKTHSGFGNSPYELALLSNRLNELYGDEIENQMCVKFFIDSLFDETSAILKRLFFTYFFFFTLPFCVQAFSNDSFVVVIANISCLLV